MPSLVRRQWRRLALYRILLSVRNLWLLLLFEGGKRSCVSKARGGESERARAVGDGDGDGAGRELFAVTPASKERSALVAFATLGSGRA